MNNRPVVFYVLFLVSLFLVSCGASVDKRSASEETLNTLLALDSPAADWIKLKEAYQGITVPPSTPTTPHSYKIGDKKTFWISRDALAGEYEQVALTLRHINDVVYVWTEDGVSRWHYIPITDKHLKGLADLFAEEIYPTTRAVFGSEPTPGLDTDPHIHILLAKIENAGAYYDPGDIYPVEVNPHSNLGEILYVNTLSYNSDQDKYLRTALAHEFTHMVHLTQNMTGESAWVTEGLATVGQEINGYDTWEDEEFASKLDIQLNAHRPYPEEEWVPHYGADHVFFSILYDRFGADFIRDVTVSRTRDIRSVQQALDKHTPGLTFDQVFADFAVAYFNKNNADNPTAITIPVTQLVSYPQSGKQTVHQYASDYFMLQPDGRKEVTFEFDGVGSVAVLPTQPQSGKYMWWAGRSGAEASLTRQVNLTGVNSATLKFSTWYDLYDHFDYVYASVSTDGGKTWKTIPGIETTDENPNAWNLGDGFTCKSGAGCEAYHESPNWIKESMDLTPYAGQTILLRFHYLGSSYSSGFAIDDIEIPEINFKDSAESDGGWDVSGFARIDNRLPQTFTVQTIEFGETVNVIPMELDDNNRGSYTTQGFGNTVSHVVVVVSAVTPFTWETAEYEYEVR